MQVNILDYGCVIQSIIVSDRDGHLSDVVLGFDSLQGELRSVDGTPMDNPAYLRYCKTFYRMGGEMHYFPPDNRDFLLALYQNLSDK